MSKRRYQATILLGILLSFQLWIPFVGAQVTEEEESPISIPYLSSGETVVDGVVSPEEYAEEFYESKTGIVVRWRHNGTHIFVALECTCEGWLAIAFGSVGTGKTGSDIKIGYVDDSSGEAVVLDHTGVTPTIHRPDTDMGGSDDVLAVGGSQEGGVTILEFVIPMDSGDPLDELLVLGEIYGFVVAYHVSNDDFVYHTAYSQPGLLLQVGSEQMTPVSAWSPDLKSPLIQASGDSTAVLLLMMSYVVFTSSIVVHLLHPHFQRFGERFKAGLVSDFWRSSVSAVRLLSAVAASVTAILLLLESPNLTDLGLYSAWLVVSVALLVSAVILHLLVDIDASPARFYLYHGIIFESYVVFVYFVMRMPHLSGLFT